MWGSPATDVEDRVVAAIADARRTTTLEAPLAPVAAAGPAPVTAARPAPVGDLAAQRVKRRSRWSMVGAAAVGAAAAALVVGVVMRRNDDSADHGRQRAVGAGDVRRHRPGPRRHRIGAA